MKNLSSESGQSLVEVLVALVVATVVIVALIVTVLTGLKNSQFAQKQSQATRVAQDALDKIKTIRDRNGTIVYDSSNYDFLTPPSLSSIFTVNLSAPVACNGACYYRLLWDGGTSQWTLDQLTVDPKSESLSEGLTRQILISDDASFGTQKYITVKVIWSDSSGEHESNLQTILTPR